MDKIKMKKALYIGANTHIEFTTYLDCKEYIFIDTQPRSEFDTELFFNKSFYRQQFIKKLFEKIQKYDFELINSIELDPTYYKKLLNGVKLPYINPHLFIFFNAKTNSILKYYISTNILYNMNSRLKQDIYETDSLYVAGYYPHKCILQYLNPNKKIFIKDNQTVYCEDEEEDDIISGFIKKEINFLDYFDKVYLVNRKENNELINIDNLYNSFSNIFL
jgi:hypothetical protein